jgi:hypothetical protein
MEKLLTFEANCTAGLLIRPNKSRSAALVEKEFLDELSRHGIRDSVTPTILRTNLRSGDYILRRVVFRDEKQRQLAFELSRSKVTGATPDDSPGWQLLFWHPHNAFLLESEIPLDIPLTADMTDTYLKWLLESVGPKVERIYRVRDCPTKFVAFFEEKPNRLPPFLPLFPPCLIEQAEEELQSEPNADRKSSLRRRIARLRSFRSVRLRIRPLNPRLSATYLLVQAQRDREKLARLVRGISNKDIPSMAPAPCQEAASPRETARPPRGFGTGISMSEVLRPTFPHPPMALLGSPQQAPPRQPSTASDPSQDEVVLLETDPPAEATAPRASPVEAPGGGGPRVAANASSPAPRGPRRPKSPNKAERTKPSDSAATTSSVNTQDGASGEGGSKGGSAKPTEAATEATGVQSASAVPKEAPAECTSQAGSPNLSSPAPAPPNLKTTAEMVATGRNLSAKGGEETSLPPIPATPATPKEPPAGATAPCAAPVEVSGGGGPRVSANASSPAPRGPRRPKSPNKAALICFLLV